MAPLTATADMFNDNPAAQLTIASIHNLTGDQSVMIGDASFNLSSWDTRCSGDGCERDGGLGTHKHYLETIDQSLNACYGNRRLKTHFINNLENAEVETEAKRGRNRHSISGKGMKGLGMLTMTTSYRLHKFFVWMKTSQLQVQVQNQGHLLPGDRPFQGPNLPSHSVRESMSKRLAI